MWAASKSLGRWGLVLMFLAGFCASSRGGTTITAVRVERAPKLDGVLNEPEWTLAAPATNFIQREPVDNASETERTEVRIVYDDRSLYVGGWCFDREPDKIASYTLARDFDPSSEDVFLIALDTYHDHRNSYYIATNANGARYDALAFNDGASFDPNWNGIWDVRTSRDDKGYYVEMEIPFSTLRFTSDSVQIWGVNFERDIQRRREFDFWQPLPRAVEATSASRSGELLGLKNIRRGNDIEIKPFGVAGWEGALPYKNAKWFGTMLDGSSVARLGGDLKAPLSSTLTLDVTANPDFAEVEDDQAVINLTRFPFFLSERREFFLESSGTFDFNFSPGTAALFYSRRIGLLRGQRVPIWGGTRVVGKMGNYDVGALMMQTGEKDEEPSTNFAVARVKRNLLGTSYIGLLAANKEQPGRHNRALGADAMFRFPNIYNRNMFEFGGAYAQTATPDVSARKSHAYRFYVAYPNDRLYASASARRIEPDFNPEVGYVARYGTATNVAAAYRFRGIGHGIDNIYVRPMDITHYYDVRDQVESSQYAFTPFGLQTTSGEYAVLRANRNFDRLDFDYPLIKDVVLPKGEHWYNDYQVEGGTSRVRDVYGYTLLSTSGFYGGRREAAYVEGGARMNQHLFCAASYEWNDVEVNRKRAITSNIGTHVNYSFSTQWLTSLFVQWNDLDERLGMNVRLHWIPNIGSDVYLTYNQTMNTNNDFEIENAAIVCKVAYRLVA